MTDSPLLPDAYSSADIFRQEQAALFRRTWQFVALRSQLAEHGDWTCVEVGGRSVVLQNFSGKLRAFHNVCAHRQSRLRQVDSCGTGPLRCPYHGWTYDEAGIAVGIPARREFDAALSDGALPRLERWRLETVGPFVFVNGAADAVSLQDSLGTLAARVSAMADAAEEVVSADALTIEANWKIVVENTVENYHVPSVHGHTLGKHVLKEIEVAIHGRHSASRFTAETSGRILRAVELAFPERPLVSTEYEHLLLFPNTLLTHVYGAFFMITRVEPLSAQRTRARTSILVTRSAACSLEATSVRALLVESNVAFIWRSYREDAPVCEAVHLGLSETSRPAILGEREMRIGEFQRAYRAMFDE